MDTTSALSLSHLNPLADEAPPAPASDARLRSAVVDVLAQWGHLIRPIAFRLVGGGAVLDDLEQEGRLGLLKAANTYEEAGGSFAAYATVCIRNAVRAAAKRARSQARWGAVGSMDEQVDEGGTLHELVGEPATQERLGSIAALRHAISQLPERDRTILEAVADGCTFEEIGKRLNLTGCRVRQIATETIARMRAEVSQSTAPPAPEAPSKKVNRGSKPRQRFEYKGRSLTKAQWAREVGISFMTLSRRLADGWDLATALETPAVVGRPKETR